MIDDLAEAELFQARIRKRIFTSIQTGVDLRVAIVGGGGTGVELSAELKRAFELLSIYGEPSLRAKLKLALVESVARLLPAFPEHISLAAAQTLSALGVDLHSAQGLSEPMSRALA
jgi:NADH dehydrogenase